MALSFRNIASAICFTLCFPQILSAQSRQPLTNVEFRRAENSPANGLIEATLRGTNQKVYLQKRNVITIKEIVEARVVKSYDSDFYEVEVSFTKQGAKKMAWITRDWIGKKLAILVDGEVISAPIVNVQVFNEARVDGALTKDEAEKIADAINCCRTLRPPELPSQSRAKIQLGRIDIEFRAADREPAEGLKEVTVMDTGQTIYLHKEPIITNRDIVEARVLKSYYGDFFEVEATLTKQAAERMTRFSQDHKGKPLAILIDGKVVSAPTVISEIHDKVKINGEFKKEEAEKIAKRLNRK